MNYFSKLFRYAGGGAVIAAMLLVAYLAGAFSTVFKTFPFPQLLERPLWAVQAHKRQADILESLYTTHLWLPAHDDTSGVVRYDSSRAYNGYTFFASSHFSGAYLVDMQGSIRHEWKLPLRGAWSDPPHIGELPPESFIHWRRAHLFPNGDVLTIYESVAITPAGCGLVKLDKDSNVIWRYPDRVHHDFALDSDGSIYTLVHGPRLTSQHPITGVPQLPSIVGNEYLVKLSEQGREQKRINILELLAESNYRAWLQTYGPREDNPVRTSEPSDVLHVNDVEVITPAFARANDFAEPGQLLVSFRNFDAIVVVDFEDREIVWGTRGFWRQQHDPDLLENGDLMLFDNKGNGGVGGPTRLLQFDPTTREVPWLYRGTPDNPFSSKVYGSQQLLPNGNILVTSSRQGRLFEITQKGELVWEYWNKTREVPDRGLVRPVTLSAIRIKPSYLEFKP